MPHHVAQKTGKVDRFQVETQLSRLDTSQIEKLVDGFAQLFDTDERLERFRHLPAVRAALDDVPDRVHGLLVYRGRGGGADALVPRRPRPAPVAGAAPLPITEPHEVVRLRGGVEASVEGEPLAVLG